mgnify:CR=1 FL=1
MNDKTKKYLDKVIEFLVGDTVIDYEQERISSPFFPPLLSPPPLFLFSFSLFSSTPFSFEKYCIDIYGLTEEEIEYVWIRYKSIIKGKIDER